MLLFCSSLFSFVRLHRGSGGFTPPPLSDPTTKKHLFSVCLPLAHAWLYLYWTWGGVESETKQALTNMGHILQVNRIEALTTAIIHFIIQYRNPVLQLMRVVRKALAGTSCANIIVFNIFIWLKKWFNLGCKLQFQQRSEDNCSFSWYKRLH